MNSALPKQVCESRFSLPSHSDQTFSLLSVTALNYENVVETGSETEEEDKLPVSEEDPLINGTGSPASLTNPEASPRAESHGLLTKEEEDDEMRDSGVEHIWPDNDILSASVDGTGECLAGLRLKVSLVVTP